MRKPGDTGGRQRLDGPGGNAVHANVVRPQVGREEAHVRLEAGLGESHDVVARDRLHGAEIGQREDGAGAARHERLRGAGQRREAVARDIVRDPERLARRALDEAAGQRFARRVRDRMHHDVERSPGLA